MLSQLAITPSQYLQQHFTIEAEQLTIWQQAIIIDNFSLLADQSGHGRYSVMPTTTIWMEMVNCLKEMKCYTASTLAKLNNSGIG